MNCQLFFGGNQFIPGCGPAVVTETVAVTKLVVHPSFLPSFLPSFPFTLVVANIGIIENIETPRCQWSYYGCHNPKHFSIIVYRDQLKGWP